MKCNSKDSFTRLKAQAKGANAPHSSVAPFKRAEGI
jgi:hypothetical protein